MISYLLYSYTYYLYYHILIILSHLHYIFFTIISKTNMIGKIADK